MAVVVIKIVRILLVKFQAARFKHASYSALPGACAPPRQRGCACQVGSACVRKPSVLRGSFADFDFSVAAARLARCRQCGDVVRASVREARSLPEHTTLSACVVLAW